MPYLCTPGNIEGKNLVNDGVRLIPDDAEKVIFCLGYPPDQNVYLDMTTIDIMSAIPDSVKYLTIIPKFSPIRTFPKNISMVIFVDFESIIQCIPNMYMWPEIDYYWFNGWQHVGISNFINHIKYIRDILPQPIYEEIFEQMDPKQHYDKY